MPTRWAQSFYWNLSDTTVPPLRLSRGGYPAWQSAATVAMVAFAPPWSLLRPWWERLKWSWRLWRRIRRVPATDQVLIETWIARLQAADMEQRAVLERVIWSMRPEVWSEARRCVRETAVTLGFNRPEAWIPYGRALKADPGQAENTFRHLRSVHELRATLRGTGAGTHLSNPDANLTIELAYQGLSAMGR